MVHSSKYGPLAIGGEGINYLSDNTVEGKDPLVNFGSRAVEHLIRNDSFEYTPDILVNSFYDSEKDEIAAFEELVGSHGGLGGEQSHAFLMHPMEWDLNNEEIIGAEELHRILKNKLN